MKLQTTKYVAVMLLFVLLSGCAPGTVSTIIGEVSVIVDLISAAAPIVAAFTGNPAAAVLLDTILTGLRCVLTAAQAPGATVGSVATSLASCIKLPASLNLPPDLPQEVAGLVTAIYDAVKTLLNNWGAKANALRSSTKPMPMTRADHHKVQDMINKLDAAHKTLTTKK